MPSAVIANAFRNSMMRFRGRSALARRTRNRIMLFRKAFAMTADGIDALLGGCTLAHELGVRSRTGGRFRLGGAKLGLGIPKIGLSVFSTMGQSQEQAANSGIILLQVSVPLGEADK